MMERGTAMHEFRLAPLDRLNRVMTPAAPALALLVAAGVYFAALQDVGTLAVPLAAGIAALLGLVFLVTAAYAPRAFMVLPDGLHVLRRARPELLFPWGTFTSVAPLVIPRSRLSWLGWPLVKVCGSAGFLGYFGWFFLKGHGMVRVYATRIEGMALLSGKTKVLVSPADPGAFISACGRYVRTA